MTRSQLLLSVLRIWGGRLLWFLVVAALSVAVLHLPHGIVRSAEQIKVVAPVGPPRTHPTQVFQVEPPSRGQAVYRATWSFENYRLALTAYLSDLVEGRLQIRLKAESQPMLPQLWRAFGNSVFTFVGALGAGLVVGILLGALALSSRLGRSISFLFSLLGLSMPDFLLVILGHILTIWTYTYFGIRLWPILGDGERGWLLPFLVLAVGTAAYTARLTVAGMDEVLREEYIRTARAKGVPEHRVVLGHALRNILPRILNGVPGMINASLSSLIIVEMLTATRGLGAILHMHRETEVAATIVIIFCAWFVVMDSLMNSLRLLSLPRLKGVA